MKVIPKIFYALIFTSTLLFSQNTSHEIGVLTGTASIQTDYGVRGDFLSETANNSTSLTVAHYMQFSSNNTWNKRKSILDHIIVKSELNYLKSADLEHFIKPSGSVVINKNEGENKSLTATQILSNMKGNISLINVGLQLEYYLKDITEFFDGSGSSRSRINPFVNFGFNYSIFNNTITSKLGDWHTDITLLPEKYRTPGAVQEGSGGAFAFNTGVGARYKLTKKLDMVAQFKWEVFASDAIDGLQAKVSENKSNETLTNLQFGLIYHLNFSKRM